VLPYQWHLSGIEVDVYNICGLKYQRTPSFFFLYFLYGSDGSSSNIGLVSTLLSGKWHMLRAIDATFRQIPSLPAVELC
jgi:hypothetical protein